ncbi:MAG: hypothetical protein LBU77_00990 [Clostridiales bacterium]|nr:hypothetical protein [Clostridiales bacterium]
MIRVYEGAENQGSYSVSGSASITLRQTPATQTPSVPPVPPVPPTAGQPNFSVWSNPGQLNIAESGSFTAQSGQRVTIQPTSTIQGGTVDFILFTPSGGQHRFGFGSSNEPAVLTLSESGTYAYNCSGLFRSGSIRFDVYVQNVSGSGAVIATPTAYISPDFGLNSSYVSADDEAITRMELSGTWGEYVIELLPHMTPGAVEKVVSIYLDRHLFPGITRSSGARIEAERIAPALAYMTEEAAAAATNRIVAYY